jgi:hypothetical protein
VHITLWPDWSPSPLARDLARFSALVKLGAGRIIDGRRVIELRMLDARGELVSVATEPFDPASGRLIGPAWQEVSGGSVRVADAVTQAEASLEDTRSDRVVRAEVAATVLLKPVAYDLGLPGEPALWWSYRNQTGEPLDIDEILRTRMLWVDDEGLRPPEGAYNGPPALGAGRALSNWWSLDDFGLVDRRVPRRFALEIRGERTEAFAYAWRRLT